VQHLKRCGRRLYLALRSGASTKPDASTIAQRDPGTPAPARIPSTKPEFSTVAQRVRRETCAEFRTASIRPAVEMEIEMGVETGVPRDSDRVLVATVPSRA